MATSIYKVTLRGDGGRQTVWTGAASSREGAITAATNAENAPRRSVVKVERRNVSGSSNEMRGSMGSSGEEEYVVLKIYQDSSKSARVVKRGLTREQAMAEVRKPGTTGGDVDKGTAWFYGFDKATRYRKR